MTKPALFPPISFSFPQARKCLYTIETYLQISVQQMKDELDALNVQK